MTRQQFIEQGASIITSAPPNTASAPSDETVSIIIPVYNQIDFTRQCLSALSAHEPTIPYEIIIVDDASADATGSYLAELMIINHHVRIIRNSTNQGFARTCNCGARAAQGTYLLFLNNDTEVLEGWFLPLFATLKSNPAIGIVGPKLIFPDDTIQHCGKVWQEINAPHSQPHHIYYKAPADHPAVNKSRDYQMLTAACIMVRKNEFLAIGGFDEEYENGWEDDDICYAYTSRGKRIYYCAESTVIHHQSKTLNEKIRCLEEQLPDQATMQSLSKALEDSAATPDQIAEAIRNRDAYAALEAELMAIRSRFERNRSRFFAKWGNRIVRNDTYYYEADGLMPVAPEPAPQNKDDSISLHSPKVSIIIPLFNKSEYTRQCLERLRSKTPSELYELILVDNGSTDDTIRLLDEQPATVKTVRNEQNFGFAHACNQGATLARASYLLFLNNDTEPLAGWLEPLIELLDKDSSVGATGSKLLFPDGTIQHAGVHLVDDAISGDPLLAIHLFYGKPQDFPLANHPLSLQALTAACLLVRKEAFLAAGGFDEGYWNGYEDVDLCLSLRQQGWKLVYEPRSVLIHHESKSGPERFSKASSNIARLHAKWLGTVTPDVICDKSGAFRETGETISLYLPPKRNEEMHQATDLPLVSIVMLTYNQLDYSKACLESIFRHTPIAYEIIFVDNASTDGTVDWLCEQQKLYANIRVILNNENRGFAAGCNQGMAQAQGEYILLLNNDVLVPPEWLEGMLECLRQHPNAGIVGPMTNSINDVQKVPDVGYSNLAELDSFALQYRKQYRHRRISYRRVVGFCMLFRRNLYDLIGGLDERFGTGNFEDDDFCIRAALEGYDIVIAGDVFIHHFGSMSFKGSNFDYDASISGNRRLFTEKWSEPVTDETWVKKTVLLRTLRKADILFQRGETEKAIELVLQEGIRTDKENPRYYAFLAEKLLAEHRFRDAAEVLQELPQGASGTALLTLQGMCHLFLGNLNAAKSCSQQALAVDVKYPPALDLLGIVGLHSGDRKGAEALFSQAIQSDPGYGRSYANLGMLRLENGDANEGLALLAQGFNLSPSSIEAACAYHDALQKVGRWAEGEPLFREALRFYPQFRRLHFLLIDILLQQNKTAEALKEIETTATLFGVDDGLLHAGLSLRRPIGPMRTSGSKSPDGERVSLCMIMKNEEDNLPRCLNSLKPVVDEIVIADTGSSDRSREIAALFGARVLSFPWCSDFSAARNTALQEAEGDWILVMDADETLSSIDYDRFRKLIHDSRGRGVAYDIETRNYMAKSNLEKWRPNSGEYPDEAGMGWTPSGKVRLFPRHPAIRFQGAIHEMVDQTVLDQGMRIEQCPIPVHHFGYLDEKRQKVKGEQYYQLGKAKLDESGGEDFKALCELAVQAGGIGKYEEALELWQSVLEKDPHFALGYFNLGYVLLQLGRFADASEACKSALKLNPDYSEVITNYAMCLLCLGDVSTAMELLEDAQVKNPVSPSLLVMLGTAKLCKGDASAGMEIYRTLTKKGVSYSDFINDAVSKLIEGGKERFAISILEAAIQSHAFNEKTKEILKELTDGRKR